MRNVFSKWDFSRSGSFEFNVNYCTVTSCQFYQQTICAFILLLVTVLLNIVPIMKLVFKFNLTLLWAKILPKLCLLYLLSVIIDHVICMTMDFHSALFLSVLISSVLSLIPISSLGLSIYFIICLPFAPCPSIFLLLPDFSSLSFVMSYVLFKNGLLL